MHWRSTWNSWILSWLSSNVFIRVMTSKDWMVSTIFACAPSAPHSLQFWRKPWRDLLQLSGDALEILAVDGQKAFWYMANRAWSVTMWAAWPLLKWLQSIICFTVVGPYRSASIQINAAVFYKNPPIFLVALWHRDNSQGRRIKWSRSFLSIWSFLAGW